MNTSYNYSDFIGLNLGESNEHETCVDSKIKQQGKTPQPCEDTTRLNDKFNKDITVE